MSRFFCSASSAVSEAFCSGDSAACVLAWVVAAGASAGRADGAAAAVVGAGRSVSLVMTEEGLAEACFCWRERRAASATDGSSCARTPRATKDAAAISKMAVRIIPLWPIQNLVELYFEASLQG